MMKNIKKSAQILAFILGVTAFIGFNNVAQAKETTKTTKTTKTVVKKTTNKKTTKTKKVEVEDIVGSKKYTCADQKGLKIVGNPEIDQNLTLIYGKNNLILSRQETETGVNRFANSETGYDLVAIPTKIMLLDTKKGMRLADDCQAQQ